MIQFHCHISYTLHSLFICLLHGVLCFQCVVGGCNATFASQGGLARHVPTHFSSQNSSKLSSQAKLKEESPSKAGISKRRKLKNKCRRSLRMYLNLSDDDNDDIFYTPLFFNPCFLFQLGHMTSLTHKRWTPSVTVPSVSIWQPTLRARARATVWCFTARLVCSV